MKKRRRKKHTIKIVGEEMAMRVRHLLEFAGIVDKQAIGLEKEPRPGVGKK